MTLRRCLVGYGNLPSNIETVIHPTKLIYRDKSPTFQQLHTPQHSRTITVENSLETQFSRFLPEKLEKPEKDIRDAVRELIEWADHILQSGDYSLILFIQHIWNHC